MPGRDKTDAEKRTLGEHIFLRLVDPRLPPGAESDESKALLEAVKAHPDGEHILLRFGALFHTADLGMGLAIRVTKAAERGDVDHKLADLASAVLRADWRLE
jgi:hypothetical protein